MEELREHAFHPMPTTNIFFAIEAHDWGMHFGGLREYVLDTLLHFFQIVDADSPDSSDNIDDPNSRTCM